MRVPVESSLGTNRDHTFIVIVFNCLINLAIQSIRSLAIMEGYGRDMHQQGMSYRYEKFSSLQATAS